MTDKVNYRVASLLISCACLGPKHNPYTNNEGMHYSPKRIQYMINGYYDRGVNVVNLACMKLVYWSVRSSSRSGGDELKEVIVTLACCMFYFIREYENLV